MNLELLNKRRRENIPRPITGSVYTHLDTRESASYPGTGTKWYDLSDNSFELDLINGVTYQATNGGELIYDGIDDRVTHPLSGASNPFHFGANAFTLEFMVKKDTVGYADGTYVSNSEGSDGSSGPEGGQAGWWFRDGWFWIANGTGVARIGINCPINEWNHFIFVVDPNVTTKIIAYKNGISYGGYQTNMSDTSPLVEPSGKFSIGRIVAGDIERFLGGSMPLVKLYSRTVSAAEVWKAYNYIKPQFV